MGPVGWGNLFSSCTEIQRHPALGNGNRPLGLMLQFVVGLIPIGPKEIWQYIMVINTAASSYLWDNVYNYDITFRHLMAFNPHRPWPVTYNQMWNLSMRDPLPKGFTQKSSHSYGPHFGNSSYSSYTGINKGGAAQVSGSKKKSDYCWNFNKGIPCKFGSKCKFIERCKYCDSISHGVNTCQKLVRKLEGNASTKPIQESKSADMSAK